MLNLTQILGYTLINEPPAKVATDVCDSIAAGKVRSFLFLNPHSAVMAEGDAGLKAAFLAPTEVLCDGVGLVGAHFLLHRRRLWRVWGLDFFVSVSTELSRRGCGRVFFLGGQEEFMPALLANYRDAFPGIAAVGSCVPPFKPGFGEEDVAEMVRRIRSFEPDVVWIGVGSPKQEKLLVQLRDACPVPCMAAIGAVFDFFSGRVEAGPQWISGLGLLWAYRLLQEPGRLWRRTLVSGPLFATLVAREMWTRLTRSTA
jgi:N-acetylglucosaminyldiphosphoundecaprenol N-acetyl-beta-D-mannosaminyltransferase